MSLETMFDQLGPNRLRADVGDDDRKRLIAYLKKLDRRELSVFCNGVLSAHGALGSREAYGPIRELIAGLRRDPAVKVPSQRKPKAPLPQLFCPGCEQPSPPRTGRQGHPRKWHPECQRPRRPMELAS